LTFALKIRTALTVITASALLAPRAAGLIEMHEGRDKITVNADYGIYYDSNLFANADSKGDTNQSLTVGANYTRRAGMLGFSCTASVTSTRFQKNSKEDFTNPSLTAELTKNDGRLTGALALTAQRLSRSDDAANMFAHSWNYSGLMGLRYPVNDRYYLTSSTQVSLRDYARDTPSLFNLRSYSEGVDLYYIYTSKLDLLGGARIRFGEARTSTNTPDLPGNNTRDFALTVGATGALLPKLTTTMRVGYQSRDEFGRRRSLRPVDDRVCPRVADE